LVFTRTKHGADKVCESLRKAGVSTAAIHGNKSQNRRQDALAGFQLGEVRVLVATDIAARGIDVDEVSHVLNYDLPEVPETYVHRIGRTARAGASGIAISFCSPEEHDHLRAIERLIIKKIPRGDASGILTTAVIRPDSIDSVNGRYDKDLAVFLPGAGERTPAKPEHSSPPRHQGFHTAAHQQPGPMFGRRSGPSRGTARRFGAKAL
jgi:superfamily II DNA/RNA helicase